MSENQAKKPSPTAGKLIEYLDCPCEVFAPLKKDGEPLQAYQKASQDAAAAYVPLLIVPDEILLEHISLDFEGGGRPAFDPAEAAGLRSERLREAEKIDAQAFLEGRLLDLLGRNPKNSEPGPIEGDNILAHFSSHWDYENNRTRELILAKIPAAGPWELAAWLPMGGFNDCPPPEIQAAVMKRWFEKYGARPALVTCDAWEFRLPKPLADMDEALKLAYEHYAFCPDRVDQYGRDEYRVGNLADSLMKSALWYFSWE